MLQLLEKDPPLLPVSTLNHLRAFRVKANTELFHSQMPLQWRSSFKRTHKSICACVWEYGNASPSRPFSSLMRNIPWVMALAASKMGNPYLPRGSSAGYGEKSFVLRERDVHVWLLWEQSFAYFFRCLFVCAVFWENMNGSIFIRGVVRGKTCGGWCFPMSACRRGGWVENLFSWKCLFLYWTVNCSASLC